MILSVVFGLVVFVLCLFALAKFLPASFSLSKRVFSAMLLGALFGVMLNLFFGASSAVVNELTNWINVVGLGYVKLLEMVLMPLVFASVLNAITKLRNGQSLGKIGVLNVSILLGTTVIAALVAIFVTAAFHLTASGLVAGPEEIKQLELLGSRTEAVKDFSVPNFLLSFMPHNPLVDLSGAYKTSVISVVIIAVLFGFSALSLYKENKVKGEHLLAAIDTFQAWVMKLVQIIISLTPYGVFALIAKMTITSHLTDIIKLGTFLVASYVAILIMFVIHGLMLLFSGISPLKYFKKAFPVISFAFGSRSSAAAIPLNIEVQTKKMGVSNAIASFSASIGATVGQNGCAGIYPAMLATMIAPTMGIDIYNPAFFIKLAFIVMISSLGVAGVGGGAVFAALIVLPIMGFPVTLVALLISVEPLVDMGRTALNVNGSMTAGVLTSRILGEMDQKTFTKAKN